MTGHARRRATAGVTAARPELVRVIRPGHPLHGLDLPVWDRLRLRGSRSWWSVLPDGSKKRIPAAGPAWTARTAPGRAARRFSRRPVTCCVLLRVISGFSARAAGPAEQAARQSPGKEDDHAACQLSLLPDQVPAPPSQLAGQLPPPSRSSRGRDPGPPDHPAAQPALPPGAAAGTSQREVSGGE